MRDKSLGIFLMVLFAIPGIAILILAWLWPTLESERSVAFLVGSVGLLVALTQLPALKRSPDRLDAKPAMIKLEAEDKP